MMTIRFEFDVQGSAIGEPSFADAIAWIENDASLELSKKTHWATSLRRMAAFLDRPPETIPARLTHLRQTLPSLNAVALGVKPKTLSNHKSNVRAALVYLRENGKTVHHGAPLQGAWKLFPDAGLPKKHHIELYPLARYCSTFGIAPEVVTQPIVDAYFEHRKATSVFKVTLGKRRALARAWNMAVVRLPQWSAHRLEEEGLPPSSQGPQWETFDPHLRAEIEAYLASRRKIRRSHSGRRIRPSKASTVALLSRQIRAYLNRAVKCGFAIDRFRSMADMLAPDVVRTVIEDYWPDQECAPSEYTFDVINRIYRMAQELNCLKDEELFEIGDMRAIVSDARRVGMTPKNRKTIRWAMSGDNWSRVVHLPDTLMETARAKQSHKGVRAAALAGIAVAIRILTYAPVRISNLSSIELDKNLVRPGGPGSPYMLVFEEYDTKNNVPLEYPLPADATALIDEYIHEFRPALLRGQNANWLFPSDRGGHKASQTLGAQISKTLLKELGMHITPHQFRHCAGALILKARPGNYELVKRVLGHTSLATTTRNYIGLETAQATEMFGEMINKIRSNKLDDR